jgi:hypothetical protein
MSDKLHTKIGDENSETATCCGLPCGKGRETLTVLFKAKQGYAEVPTVQL